MSVLNKTPSVITDVSLDFIFEDDLLRIDRYDPQYELKNGKILLGNLYGDSSKSIAVYFDPLMCTKSAEISCQVNFRDAHGKRSSVFMEPKLISVVCPIINTDHDINVGRLKGFIEELPNRDSKIYEIQHGFDISKLASIACDILEKHNVRHVRTLKTKDGREHEIWYYGRTKVTKADIVIKVSISSEKQFLELFAATETAESLTGLLAEFGRDLKSSIESWSSGKGNVINITIRDSVIQRSNLIDFCSMDGSCPVNILVEDSVVQHSTFFSGKDELREEERLKKETEEPERGRRQQEEEARSKKVEEERLLREKEIKEQKRLRRQKEEEAERLEGIKRKAQQEEAERQSRDKLERKTVEEASKDQAVKEETISYTQQNLPPKKPPSSSSTAKPKRLPRKRILAFSLIFGVFLIVSVAMFLGSNGDSDDRVAFEATAKTNTDQTSSSQNSDTYTNSMGMEFVKIPSGEFNMGTYGSSGSEGPVHEVTINESFYLGKFEVTQEQWRDVMDSNPSEFEGEDLPVDSVSWNDAQNFIKRLNEMEGTDKYRLPSEAEWEYACRAGTTTIYYTGDDESELGDYAWYDDVSGSTHPVGQKKPSPWGLYDMYGNVGEWVQDTYHTSYEGAPSDGSAWKDGDSSDRTRVVRGGDWYSFDCRSASRGGCGFSERSNRIGFRVLKEV